MKKVLLATAGLMAMGLAPVFAADLSVKAPYGAPSPVWNWTGFYAGVHAGAGWGTTESTLISIAGLGAPAGAINLPIAQNSRSGFLGGGQIGYNYQSGWAVFGVQADIAGLDVKGTTPCLGGGLSCTAKSDWLATATGRMGGLVNDKTLVYVKGGAAWLHTTHSLAVPAAGFLGPGIGGGVVSSVETTTFGWLIGMGAEYAFSPNWSAFLEYNYMEFDKKNAALDLTALGGFGAGAVTSNVDFKNKLSIAKVGVNYKFGGPVVGRY